MLSSAAALFRLTAAFLLLVAISQGQSPGGRLPVPPLPQVQPVTFWERLTADYRTPPVARSTFTDTPRLESLVQNGNLYLSLPDALAIALENNLDIELQRYTPRVADTDFLRASAGGQIRGLPVTIREGPQGVGSPRLLDVTTGSTSGQLSGVSLAINQSSESVEAVAAGIPGFAVILSGPAVPLFDPVVSAAGGWDRQTTPQVAPFLTGTQFLRLDTTPLNFGFQKGFLSGGVLTTGLTSTRVNQNSLRVDLNPSTAGALILSFTQPLLRGFGCTLNRRFIRIARNNRDLSEAAFEQQVISTVSAVLRLYWDLVTLNQDLNVRAQTLTLNQALLDQADRQEKAGTLAPIEVTRARAEVARARRDQTVAEASVRQQETILKDFLSRRVSSPVLATTVRLVPTSAIELPSSDPVVPEQDLVAMALERRPDLRQARIQVENSRISLIGSRNALLPSLDLVVTGQTNSLYGRVNPLPLPPDIGGGAQLNRSPDPAFLGGFGTGLEQIFTGQFPNYGAQLQLTIPLWNRTARADVIRDQLLVRQLEVRLRQIEKQVRVDVLNAMIALQQAHAAYDAAVEQRFFQDEALRGEEVRYRTGVTTLNSLIQFQRDLALARSSEVVALSDYVKARNGFDRSTGMLLVEHNIELDEAYRGRVTKAPTVPIGRPGQIP